MYYNKFINMIENNSAEMARQWVKMILKSDFTKTYHKQPEEELLKIAQEVYDNLGKWLGRETTKIEIGKIYAQLGKDRYNHGFPLCELLYAVSIEKKVLTDKIITAGLLPDALNLYNAIDFLSSLYDFFDIALFYVVRGFHEEMYKKVGHIKGVDKKELNSIFPAGSFYYAKKTNTEEFEQVLEGFNLFKMK